MLASDWLSACDLQPTECSMSHQHVLQGRRSGSAAFSIVQTPPAQIRSVTKHALTIFEQDLARSLDIVQVSVAGDVVQSRIDTIPLFWIFQMVSK